MGCGCGKQKEIQVKTETQDTQEPTLEVEEDIIISRQMMEFVLPPIGTPKPVKENFGPDSPMLKR